jgi:hypothetical protein
MFVTSNYLDWYRIFDFFFFKTETSLGHNWAGSIFVRQQKLSYHHKVSGWVFVINGGFLFLFLFSVNYASAQKNKGNVDMFTTENVPRRRSLTFLCLQKPYSELCFFSFSSKKKAKKNQL